MQKAAAKKEVVKTLSKSFEERLWASGFEGVAGVDEAGRGPLAGPVRTCCTCDQSMPRFRTLFSKAPAVARALAARAACTCPLVIARVS